MFNEINIERKDNTISDRNRLLTEIVRCVIN